MLGFTGVILVLVAVSRSGVGNAEVAEKYDYIHIDIRVEGGQGSEPSPKPQLLFDTKEVTGKIYQPDIVRHGPHEFSFVLHASSKQVKMLKHKKKESVEKVSGTVYLNGQLLSRYAIKEVHVSGELEPTPESKEYDGVRIIRPDEVVRQINSSARSYSNGIKLRFELKEIP